MLLLDFNILVYAFRVDAPDHAAYRQWLEGVVAAVSPFGLADIVLSGFLRTSRTHGFSIRRRRSNPRCSSRRLCAPSRPVW